MVVSEQSNAFPFAKWTCYDKGLQSGMIVRWPGKVEPDSQSNAMVEYVDVVPTFIQAAGLEFFPHLEGQSFLPVLRGWTKAHKQYSFGLQTTRGINHGSECYGIRSVRSDRFRYSGNDHARQMVLRFQERPTEEIYDSLNDPWNLNNLANQPELQDQKKQLSAILDAWMNDQGDLGQATELSAKERQWRNRKR